MRAEAELLEIQVGTSSGASQQTTTTQVAALSNPAIAAAQTAAQTFATNAANTAQTNAETFATNAANTAQSNAETYAASQASTAQSNAETYTNGLVGQVLGVNAQTTAYTLVLADKGKDVQVTSSSALNVTIPLNSSVAFPIGTLICVSQMGTGVVTIVGISGVTVEAAFGAATTAQYDMRVIEQVATNIWRVM